MNNSTSRKPSVLLLGATGCVGKVMTKLLDMREDINLIFGARDIKRLQELSNSCKHSVKFTQIDLDRLDSLSKAVIQDRVDIIVNCTGRYRESGMIVAETVVENGINLIDIADEPIYLQEVFSLDSKAKANKCILVIGSGTSPQTTGALLRFSMNKMKPGVVVNIGICFGVNKVGHNAVRTATEAIGGCIALKSTQNIWKPGALINFQRPFSRLWARHYPLPETVYLRDMKGIDKWFAGVCLNSHFLNNVVVFLRRTGLAQRLTSSKLPLRIFCSINSFIESTLAASGIGKLGIAVHVEVKREKKAIISYLYHYDMVELTARAAAVTLNNLIKRDYKEGGIFIGHEFIKPNLFLKQLEELGIVWSFKEVVY